MSSSRLLAVLLALTCVCGATTAQVTGQGQAPEPMPPVESVLTHVPAGTMGFVVINNIDDLLAKMDTFYNEIGAPGGPMPPMKDAMLPEMVGPDFNINGGFAAVMLDPRLFDVDLAEVLSESMMGGYAAEEYFITEDGEVIERSVDDDFEETPAVPYVLFLPGLDAANVLPADRFQAAQEGDYTVITNTWTEGILYAIKVGGYILLSPNTEALEYVRAADSHFADEVSAEEFLEISEADAAAYANMAVSGPVISDVFRQLNESGAMPPMGGMYAGMMTASLSDLDSQLAQMESIFVQFYFTETGLKLIESVVFAEDSMIGQYAASQPAAGGSLVDKLPDLPYMLAAGVRCEMNEEMKAQSLEALSNMLNTPETVDVIGQDIVDRMLALADEMYDDVSEVQFVIGGAPEGSGTVAAAIVFSGKNAQSAMADLPDRVALAETAINSLIRSFDSDEANLTISVVQGAETVAGVPVDRLVLDHPVLDEMDADDQETMEAILGTSDFEFLVAAPDDNTMIVTFGGGSAMMAEAIQAARTGGTVAASEGVAEVLAELPSDPYMVGLVSLGNIGRLIDASMQAIDVVEEDFLGNMLGGMESAKPIAMAAAFDGATIQMVAFAPNDVIADAAASVTAWQQAMQQRWIQQMQQQQGGADPAWDEEGEPAPVEDPGF